MIATLLTVDGAPHSIYPTEQAARLALAAMVIDRDGPVDSAEVHPVEVPTGLSLDALREVLGAADDTPVDQLLARVGDLVDRANPGRHLDLLAGLRLALGAGRGRTPDELLAQVRTLVERAQPTVFEVPSLPTSARIVWTWDQETGDSVSWARDTTDRHGASRWVRFGAGGTVLAACSGYELVTQHGPVSTVDPSA